MKAEDILEFYKVLEKMKSNTRHSWNANGRQESVADHSFSTAFLAMLVADEFPDLDMDRVIRMCLLHDIGEAVTGDIPCFEKKEADEVCEGNAVRNLLASLPAREGNRFLALWEEMEKKESPEAKLYKILDRIDAVMEHNEADISSWLPLEYELQVTYGREEAKAFPFTEEWREAVVRATMEKIADSRSQPA